MKKMLTLLAFSFVLAGCGEESLLQGLDQGQVNEVIAILYRHNIDTHKKNNGKSGYSIDVERRDFPAAVDILKSYDLPSRKPLQIADMFPADSMVTSPRAEKARLYSGIEQRLEQSLYTMAGIVSARVHVSYDLDAVDGGRKARPVHLSALANYEGDVDVSVLINDVKRFLKNSFADVEYENISVVLSRRAALQHQGPRKSNGVEPFFSFGILILIVAVLVISTGIWLKNNKKIHAWKEVES